MEENIATKQRAHKVMLTNRRTCMVSGVADVLSFYVTIRLNFFSISYLLMEIIVGLPCGQ